MHGRVPAWTADRRGVVRLMLLRVGAAQDEHTQLATRRVLS